MKISIITATYNSAKTIADCIISVNNQTYNEIEHLIIDGASGDNTVEIIKSIPNRVTQIVSEPDQGIYDAMNKGIRLATGDIVGILNSDDFYASDTIISNIVEIFNTSGCDSLYGNLDFVTPEKINKVLRHWKSSLYIKGSFTKGWHPPHPTFFVRREIYEKFGLFNTSLYISADFELMLRFLEKNCISTHFLDSTIVKMRYGGASTRSLKAIWEGNKNVIQAFRINGIELGTLYTIRRFAHKLTQFLRR